MIPKTIHYCWFSGDEHPALVKRCLDSWRKVLPEYEIKCWDGASFDFDSVPYVREAMALKKYAFAADYVRLYALYTEGGIYLDSDVEVVKSFDPYMHHSFFTGTEPYIIEGQEYFDVEAAIIGSVKGHPYLKEVLDYYQTIHFTPENPITICHIMVDILKKYGYTEQNRLYELSNGVVVYPLEHYGDRYCFHNQTAIHWCQFSWSDTYHERGRLYYFCQKRGLMWMYRMVERLVRLIKR